jgi:hypothetical protein
MSVQKLDVSRTGIPLHGRCPGCFGDAPGDPETCDCPPLTARQRNLLAHIAVEGEACEGYAFDALYYVDPPIRWRGMRRVASALRDRGLIVFAEWEDDHAGYLLRITDAGRKAVAS